MQVGIRRKIIIAMAQPSLNIFQGIAQIQHNGGTAVAKVVESDGSQSILFQELLKLLGHVVRL